MAKKKFPFEQNPAAVEQARDYAIRLAVQHGLEYPGFVEAAQRVDAEYDRLLTIHRGGLTYAMNALE